MTKRAAQGIYMEHIERGVAKRSGDICASGDEVWRLLMDWAGIARWLDNRPRPDYVPFEVRLEGTPDQVPRTRVISRPARPGGTPSEVRETIIMQDDAGKRCYYVASDGFRNGIRNYLASAFVEATAPSRCTMTVRSTFDVTGDADDAKAVIETIYASIFSGFNQYFSTRGDDA